MPSTKPKKIGNLLQRVRNCIKEGAYRDTFHALERKSEREITLPEVIYVLTTGRHEKSKDRFERVYNTWNYSIRGLTVDEQDLRVIVSFDEDRDLLIITTISLERRHTK